MSVLVRLHCTLHDNKGKVGYVRIKTRIARQVQTLNVCPYFAFVSTPLYSGHIALLVTS